MVQPEMQCLGQIGRGGKIAGLEWVGCSHFYVFIAFPVLCVLACARNRLVFKYHQVIGIYIGVGALPPNAVPHIGMAAYGYFMTRACNIH